MVIYLTHDSYMYIRMCTCTMNSIWLKQVDVWPARFVFLVTTIAYLYLCRPPFCGDSVSVYNGTTAFKSLSRKVCHRQSSKTVVALKGRTAYVRFKSDTVKGTGTGFRGCFKAEGTFCEINLTYK